MPTGAGDCIELGREEEQGREGKQVEVLEEQPVEGEDCGDCSNTNVAELATGFQTSVVADLQLWKT